MDKINFDEVGKALKMYHEYLEANRQLEDNIITVCPKSPTGEHKWEHDDAYYSDFCKYCGIAKFHEQLNVLAGGYKNEKEKQKHQCIEASMSPRPKGFIFKRCPNCNKRLKRRKDCIRSGNTRFGAWGPIDYTPGLYCYYYTCPKCGYKHGMLIEK